MGYIMFMMLFLFGCTNAVQVISFTDNHNYEFSSAITAESTTIIPEQDGVVDWQGLQTSLIGYDIDPQTDIAKLSILHFPRLSEEDILAGISNETLKQSDLSEYAEFYPNNQTQTALTTFSFQGVTVDPVEHLEEDTGRFLLSAVSATGETLMLSFFHTDAAAQKSEIVMHSQSAELSYQIDLRSSERANWETASRHVIDWSNVSKSGTGKELSSGQIDTMMLASFSESLAELEDLFLTLPNLAVDYFEADVFGTTAIDVSELGFTDFDHKTWLFVLRCQLCINPAPVFVGVIQP